MKKLKVAIVHDYLTQYGGAERVLDVFHEMWPAAPVMVGVVDLSQLPERYRGWDIRSSWLSRLPVRIRRKHQSLLAFYPHAFEAFDLQEYDLVVSSSSGFAHGVLTGPETTHVCYCHSPPRFLWDYHSYAQRERLGPVVRSIVGSQLAPLRVWDRMTADRADSWISTSRVVERRIAKYYGKTSTIIAPPVEVGRFELGRGPGEYYLLLMRLVGWKRPDIVIEACSRMGLPLVVAGSGREEQRLRKMAGPSVQFVGRVDDAGMRKLYAEAKALILPSEEDFGITPLEAMSAGRPVIAYGRAGALDTVVEGTTGVFFAEQTADSLADAIRRFQVMRFDPQIIRRQAMCFDTSVFRARIARHVEATLGARTATSLASRTYVTAEQAA